MSSGMINSNVGCRIIKKLPIFLVTICYGMVGVACANPYRPIGYEQDKSIDDFNDAERLSSNPSALVGFESRMAGGLFEMYPTYWRLNKTLSYQNADEIIRFNHRYTGSVMAEKLIADYAEEKAKINDYTAVRAVADYIENADASEACAQALGYSQSTENFRTLEQKPFVWLNTQRMPALCDKLADEMIYHAYISQTDRQERLIRMMRMDGRKLSGTKPALNKESQIVSLLGQLGITVSVNELSQVKSNPKGAIANIINNPFSQKNQYLYVYAISQLAHSSYAEAARQLASDIATDDRRAQRLIGDMARRYAWRAIAVKRMNMNTDSGFGREAVSWFYNSLGEPFNFEESEDYAQAAIYFGLWQDVERAIGTMTVAAQNERIWQYWLARSYEQQGRKADAIKLYQNLSDGIDYYGLLAKDRLGQSLTLQDIGGNELPAANQALVMSDPNFARSILLMQHNSKAEYSNREWNWAVKKARDDNNQRLIVSAARMAQELGNYPRSIYAMQNSDARNGALSHPMPFKELVIRHSQAVGIDPAWVYGIMRQESRFQTTAQSSTAAQGLMQIIPSTASLIAKSLGERAGNMADPNTNIRYGTWYLADMHARARQDIVVATASYNAGTRPATAWRPTHAAIEADQYVEAIAYGETRDYVKNVMENAAIYSVLLGRPVSILARMGMVAPK